MHMCKYIGCAAGVVEECVLKVLKLEYLGLQNFSEFQSSEALQNHCF